MNLRKILIVTTFVVAFLLTLKWVIPKLNRKTAKEKPNVLFIAIDDLNDWIKPLNPDSPILTPNLDRLLNEGTLFTNAHCSAPVCNASRASLMTGLRPSSTGVYSNNSDWRKALPEAKTISQHFMDNGYSAIGAGKIFHHGMNGAFHDKDSFEDFLMMPNPPDAPTPQPRLCGIKNWIGGDRDGKPISPTSLFDWGPYPKNDNDAVDYKTASYAVDWLSNKHDKPWFLATGFFRPHMPFYAPQKYYDMYPLEDIKMPPILKDDILDISSGGRHLLDIGKPFIYETIIQNGKLKEAVQAYYASVSFLDAQLGRVLNALDDSPYRGNTIIILWSDHGYHLGEKEHWEKFVLWEKSTRMPLFISAPGVTKPNTICTQPVSLLDIYPTLNSLCDLPEKPELEGNNITPLLKNPKAVWQESVISTYLRNNHAVRSQRYRYIIYADGSEELYDHETDVNEWVNLANDKKYLDIIEEHKKWLPKINVPRVDDLVKND